MIRSTFCHLQGIGEVTEARLWADGLDCWAAAATSELRLPRLGLLSEHVHRSIESLARGDYGAFGKVTRGALAWRWYALLRSRAVYLDIETTGLSPDYCEVTCVGCWDGNELTMFVRDDNLVELRDYLSGFHMLVTYNGSAFDVPFLKAALPGLRLPPVHLDLLWPLRRLDLRGGLKSIEVQTDLARDEGLREVDGFLAVLLWQRHLWGDARALPTLLRYCAEDTVVLQSLAELVYERSLALLPPLPAPAVHRTPRPELALAWSADLVDELQGAAAAGPML